MSTAYKVDTFVSRTPRFDSPAAGRELTLTSLLRLFQKRRWVAAAVAFAVLLVGTVIAFLPPRYTATGSIRVRPGSTSMYNVTAEKMLSGSDTDDRIESEVTVLQSKSLLLEVVRQLDLLHDPAFLGKSFGKNASLDDASVRNYVIQAMKKRVRVERVPKTEVISIQCTSRSPLQSAKVVNALANSYIGKLFRNSFASTQRASEWLNGQLNDLKQNIDHDQEQLVEMQGHLGGVGFDDTHNLVASQLESLAKANAEADVERIVAEARYHILQNADPSTIEGAISTPTQGGMSAGGGGGGSLLQSLRDQKATLSAHYADLNAQFGPNYPDVKQARAQLAAIGREINEEQDRITHQAELNYRAAQQNQTMTQDAFSKQKADALQKSSEMAKYQILLHEYQVNRTLYEGLTERLREAGIISGLASNEVDIVDIADVPYAPSGPTKVEVLGVSALFGLVAATIAVFLTEALDTSVGGMDELVSLVEMPALAVLPELAAAKNSTPSLSRHSPALLRPATHEILTSPGSPFSEGIRSLRTALLLSRAPRPPKVVLFTSAGPKEGKSTISGNVACLLAQYNSKVLLIDADLRLPVQHNRFRISNTRGLSSVLTGAVPLAQAVESVEGLPNLKILTAGPWTAAAGMLVSSPEMQALLKRCSQEFDFVLLDSPPCAAISDAVMLAHMSEAVVLVVRDGVSKKVALRRVVETLLHSGAVMPGFVLNGVERRSLDYRSYYGDYGAYRGAELPGTQDRKGASYEV